jgi:hypothetical protein
MARVNDGHYSLRGFLLAAALVAMAPCLRSEAEENAAGAQAGAASVAAPGAASVAAPLEKVFDPLPLIGLDPAAAFGTFGPPLEIFPFEQTVVFYYPDHKYLFWFQNRIWQVRVDRRYELPTMGFRMGEGKAETTARIGRLFKESGDAVSFHIAEAGFPMEARLIFEDGKLSDLYVYRSDW